MKLRSIRLREPHGSVDRRALRFVALHEMIDDDRAAGGAIIHSDLCGAASELRDVPSPPEKLRIEKLRRACGPHDAPVDEQLRAELRGKITPARDEEADEAALDLERRRKHRALRGIAALRARREAISEHSEPPLLVAGREQLKRRAFDRPRTEIASFKVADDDVFRGV